LFFSGREKLNFLFSEESAYSLLMWSLLFIISKMLIKID
jgi:hypothetical protein